MARFNWWLALALDVLFPERFDGVHFDLERVSVRSRFDLGDKRGLSLPLPRLPPQSALSIPIRLDSDW